MSIASVLSGLARVGGRAVEGYAVDEENRVRAALADQKLKQDASRDAVLNALADARRIKLQTPEPVEYTPAKFMAGGKAVQGFTTKAGGYFDANRQPVADATPYEEPKDTTPSGTVMPGADGQSPQLVVTRPGGGHELGSTIAVPGVTKASGGATGLSGGALKTAIAENRTQIEIIDDAIASLTANPTATGLRRGLGAIPGLGKIGELVNQKVDAEGNPTRDKLGRISSVVIKDISGANVTGPEWSRLGWVPDQSYDHARNLEKLKAMRDFAETKTKELERAMGGAGAAATTPSGSADPEFDALMAKYKKP